MNLLEKIAEQKTLFVNQRHELAELVGYETRNKYEILAEDGTPIGFAAEQQKGIGAFLLRQVLGHWRTFEVYIFDQSRQLVLRCQHPFRFFFNRFEVRSADGSYIGALQQRFSVLNRRFDVLGPRGEVLFEMISPLFRIWTFKFVRRGTEVARIEKKWSGILSEGFTDKDKFKLNMADPNLDSTARSLLLSACLFVDLMYFEKKARD